MCLALPAWITEIHDGDSATVTLGGVRKQVSLALVENAEVGDYVIVHVGYALSKLDPEEAERTLALLTSLAVDGGEAVVLRQDILLDPDQPDRGTCA